MVALLATYGIAVPLNINLGAYSPALVVGDGEISFGGKADVTSLMNALEGAAVNGAAANGQATPAAPATPATAIVAPAAAAPATGEAAQIASLQGMGKEIAPRVIKLEERKVLKRDLTGFNAALNYAKAALSTGPTVELGTEAAGVGILVRPNTAGTKAATPAAAAPAKKAKRDVTPKLKTTVTTMFVRGGPAPAGELHRFEMIITSS